MARQQRQQRQQRNWEDHGKELAAQMTDAAIAKLEEEIQGKRERLGQLDEELRETSVAQKIEERSQLWWEVADLGEQLSFARDAVKPKMVRAAGKAGRSRDGTGCFS